MKRKLVGITAAILAGLFGVTLAALADNGQGCQQIRSRALVDAAGQESCEFDGYVFPFCIVGELRGNFRGSWVSYYDDGWIVDLSTTTLPEPVPFTSNYAREFEVLTSKKGTLFGDAQYIFDVRIFDVNAPFPLLIIITDGTDKYEGATGWLIATFSDTSFDRAKIRGKVCGPNIPHDDDSDSDD